MRTILALLSLAVALATSPASAQSPFDDFGYELDASQVDDLRLWHSSLPAVGQAGQMFIGCSARTNATIETFDRHFEICWNGWNVPGACAHRCGASFHVFGLWSWSRTHRQQIDYAIFCRCNQIRHDYARYPVPRVLQQIGVAN